MNCNDSDVFSSSCPLHSSILSASSDIELSFIAATHHNGDSDNQQTIMPDELPKFRIREISPRSRSVSPIIFPSIEHDTQQIEYNEYLQSIDYVSVSELDAQIQPPSDEASNELSSCLETIYEGVYLKTPNKTRTGARNVKNLIDTTILLEDLPGIQSSSPNKENQHYKILESQRH